jgi:hypothetical protein
LILIFIPHALLQESLNRIISLEEYHNLINNYDNPDSVLILYERGIVKPNNITLDLLKSKANNTYQLLIDKLEESLLV